MSQTIELPRVGGPGSGLGSPWRVVVLNDDHNTFDHVARTLAAVIPAITVQQGYDWFSIVDRHTENKGYTYVDTATALELASNNTVRLSIGSTGTFDPFRARRFWATEA